MRSLDAVTHVSIRGSRHSIGWAVSRAALQIHVTGSGRVPYVRTRWFLACRAAGRARS